MKYIGKFREHFFKVPAFTARDARLFLSQLGAGKEYPYLLLTNLLRKGEIRKLKRGTYTFGNDPMLASFAYFPSYHGLQDALSLLDLWDQETNAVIITPAKARSGMREILGGKVIVKRISRGMFFGFDSIKYFDYWIPVSDVEKTLIDFIYFREPLQEEVLARMKKRINRKKMEEYLKRCPERVGKKVRLLLS